MLRDLGREDDQIDAVLGVLAEVSPDVLLLTDFDYDLEGMALAAFAARAGYDHWFAAQPNTGMMTTLDLDQNGKFGEPRDAQGYGRFRGDGGMAVLSRWPMGEVTDYSAMLWQDLPGAVMPEGWPEEVNAAQRLSHVGHWIVPVEAPGGVLNLMAFSASPPVFDGPEDRNGLRNRDELRLWSWVLDQGAPEGFVVLGNANLDPVDGQGRRDAMVAFLGDPRLQDPMPRSEGGALAADADHQGDPALDTADWRDGAPGNLRVSYVLPAATWEVTDAGVYWPAPDEDGLLGEDGLLAGPHRLVWVDVRR